MLYKYILYIVQYGTPLKMCKKYMSHSLTYYIPSKMSNYEQNGWVKQMDWESINYMLQKRAL